MFSEQKNTILRLQETLKCLHVPVPWFSQTNAQLPKGMSEPWASVPAFYHETQWLIQLELLQVLESSSVTPAS